MRKVNVELFYTACTALFFLILMTGKSLVWAQTSSPGGFYYDEERQKYFSNGKSVFTLHPITSKEYLEKIEVSIDGEDFKKHSGPLSFIAEGPHQIRFRSVDLVLNWSPVQTFRIFVDKTAPKSYVVWQGSTYYSNNDLFINPETKLNVVSQDNLSGVFKTLWVKDGKTSAIPANINFTGEGKHSFDLFSIDNVGNQELPIHLTFVLDATSPKTEAEILGVGFRDGEKMYIGAGTQINLKANDALSGVQRIEYQINEGSISTFSRPIMLSENESVIKYRSVDNVGNKENWHTMNIFQDTKPPRINVSMVGHTVTVGGKIYARPGFAFKIDCRDDGGSGIKDKMVSLDGKNYSKTDKGTFTFESAGENHFQMKAVDNVGNMEESNPYVVVIDNIPPSVMLKSSEPLVKKDNIYISSIPNRITFETVDQGVGTDAVEISYDGENFTKLASPIELSEWKKERQTIYYRAFDRLGNTSKVEKAEINVRTTAPKVELYIESDNLPNVPLSALKKGGKVVAVDTGNAPVSTVPQLNPVVEKKEEKKDKDIKEDKKESKEEKKEVKDKKKDKKKKSKEKSEKKHKDNKSSDSSSDEPEDLLQ